MKKIGFMFIFLILCTSSVFAITASMGSSRMILRLDVGEQAERSILVKNVNDVPIRVEFSPSGDLAENVVLRETSLSLQPGEEKKAYFTIKTDEPGKTETRINVAFTPEEGTPVDLSSVIIVIAGDQSSSETEPTENPTDEEIEQEQEEEVEESIEGIEEIQENTVRDEPPQFEEINADNNGVIENLESGEINEEKSSYFPIWFMSLLTTFLLLLFFVLGFYYLKSKKGMRRHSE